MSDEINKETNLFDLRTVDEILKYAAKFELVYKIISCIYFLFRKGELIYIGQTINLISRLGTHLESKEFDEVYYIEVDENFLDELEHKYIKRFSPRYNLSEQKKKFNSINISKGNQWYLSNYGSFLDTVEEVACLCYRKNNGSLIENRDIFHIELPKHEELLMQRKIESEGKLYFRKTKILKYLTNDARYLIYSYIQDKFSDLFNILKIEITNSNGKFIKELQNNNDNGNIDQLIEYQERNKLTNEELAKKCKVHLYTLEHWLKQKRLPKSERILNEIKKFLEANEPNFNKKT